MLQSILAQGRKTREESLNRGGYTTESFTATILETGTWSWDSGEEEMTIQGVVMQLEDGSEIQFNHRCDTGDSIEASDDLLDVSCKVSVRKWQNAKGEDTDPDGNTTKWSFYRATPIPVNSRMVTGGGIQQQSIQT